jgi:hypothetical protein
MRLQPEETGPFVESLRAVPKSGLHNPLKNPERCAQPAASAPSLAALSLQPPSAASQPCAGWPICPDARHCDAPPLPDVHPDRRRPVPGPHGARAVGSNSCSTCSSAGRAITLTLTTPAAAARREAGMLCAAGTTCTARCPRGPRRRWPSLRRALPRFRVRPWPPLPCQRHGPPPPPP